MFTDDELKKFKLERKECLNKEYLLIAKDFSINAIQEIKDI